MCAMTGNISAMIMPLVPPNSKAKMIRPAVEVIASQQNMSSAEAKQAKTMELNMPR